MHRCTASFTAAPLLRDRVTALSTVPAREALGVVRLERASDRQIVLETLLENMPYLGSTREVADATDLIRTFGEQAGYEAAARADRSRDLGNHLHFCKWRQIERLVVLMSIPRAVGTIH